MTRLRCVWRLLSPSGLRREREALEAYERLIAENAAAREGFHFPPRD